MHAVERYVTKHPKVIVRFITGWHIAVGTAWILAATGIIS